MARLPRLKVEDDAGWYHLCSRVAGWIDWCPFEDPLAREQLLRMIRKYLSVYCCQAAGYCLMGNHHHLIVRFERYRHLSREELYDRARLLYRKPDLVLRTPEQWQRFHRRLFDVSEFMRNLQQSYAKWYNRRFERRGSFWGERFKSSILANNEALLNALLYVELNPVRAGLVDCPENWQYSSARLRAQQQDSWLTPLSELLGEEADPQTLLASYRVMLYYRGAIRTKAETGVIAEDLIKREKARGFREAGSYSRRLRFFTEGLVLGSQLQVEDWIQNLRRRGYYLRRRYSIAHRVEEVTFYTLREQRSVRPRV